ncbi:MAG: hypothetical protein ACI8Z1_001048 [Candidatus Azotimanducaceae bacterium]|jgi:hypothetical protein
MSGGIWVIDGFMRAMPELGRERRGQQGISSGNQAITLIIPFLVIIFKYIHACSRL